MKCSVEFAAHDGMIEVTPRGYNAQWAMGELRAAGFVRRERPRRACAVDCGHNRKEAARIVMRCMRLEIMELTHGDS